MVLLLGPLSLILKKSTRPHTSQLVQTFSDRPLRGLAPIHMEWKTNGAPSSFLPN